MICAGCTGAGKSVFLNFLICETTLRYDPRSYELWLVDYKGNEFSKYLAKEGHPSVLPHLRVCLGAPNSDGAGTVFKALAKTCEVRFNLLREEGFKNIKQYNEGICAKADTMQSQEEKELSKLLPRILCINDEFQIIFQQAEEEVNKMVSDISYIIKVGRAVGVHLCFTSQSIIGALDTDILNQFTLRFALRCSESVSQQVLGCNLASQIKQKNGYLYAKCLEDKSTEQIKYFRTPFICDEGSDEKNSSMVDEVQEHVDRMAALAEERGMPKKDVVICWQSLLAE